MVAARIGKRRAACDRIADQYEEETEAEVDIVCDQMRIIFDRSPENTSSSDEVLDFSSELHLSDFSFLLCHPEGHQILQSLIEATPQASRRSRAARGAPA